MAKKRDLEGNRLHHFELSGENRTVRWILIGVLLVIGAVALTFGLMKALETPAGWQQVDGPSAGLSCSHEFTLMYDFGAGERSATEERKTLQPLYAEACVNGWKLFYNEAGQTDVTGLYALNQQPNARVQVDAHLYDALKQLVENGTRAIYLAPVYAAYSNLFYSDDEATALQNDPTTDPNTKDYVAKLAGFANDPDAIQLELHGDDQVTLHISQEYLTYAKENEIACYVDLGWLRNAFLIDYLAQKLTENGFVNGYMSSVDGFVRNLDPRDTGYSFNLFDKGEAVAIMNYPGAASIAFLRSYPGYEADLGRYYAFSDGRVVTSLIDPGDGQSKTAADQLVTYSREKGCADLALAMLPVYVTEDLDEQLLSELTKQEIYSIWFAGAQLRYNLQDLQLQLYDESYTPQLVN